MKKAEVNKFKQGTAEYTVRHAQWQRSRGRRPSAFFWWETNPKKALAFAKKVAYFPITGVYLEGAIPKKYRCEKCGATGYKLWREYQTFHPTLLCARCAAKSQKKSIRGIDQDGTMPSRPFGRPVKGMKYERTDQIGWFIPAVPSETGDGYWGYTSIPNAGVDWWRELPTLPPE